MIEMCVLLFVFDFLMNIPMYFRYVCNNGAHNVAFLAAHWSHNFDENPCAFRTILPLRSHALITKFSISVVNFSVHSDAAFDENPCAILRNLNRHGYVNLTAWDVHFLHHDARSKSK